ncbi:MAG: universal stress protein [Gemmatimonadales bacterium]
MQPETAMFRKILVPLDHSPLAEQAIGPAAALARAARADMDLVLVHEPFHRSGYAAAERRADRIDFDYKYLKSIAAEITRGASVPTTVAVVAGEPAEMIRDRARTVDADLIVMTSHGRTGVSRAWLGSTADALVHAATIPVLMLRPTKTATRKLASKKLYEHILVTLDGSARSAEVVPLAEALAAACKARLTVLSVVPHVPLAAAFDPTFPIWSATMIPDVEATKQLERDVAKQMNELAARLRDRTKLSVDAVVVVSDDTAAAVVDFIRGHDIDAVALSTHGRGASRLLLGSVADKVVRSTGVPVLLQRSSGASAAVDWVTADGIAEQLPAIARA